MESQKTQEDAKDPTDPLEKLIKLDKKNCNFDFFDSVYKLKVRYPSLCLTARNNQHLLKVFWRHVNNYYFRKITDQELQRIEYFQKLTHNEIELSQFKKLSRNVFNGPDVIEAIQSCLADHTQPQFMPLKALDFNNLLRHLYITQMCAQYPQLEKRYSSFFEAKARLIPVGLQGFYEKLKEQSRMLDVMMECINKSQCTQKTEVQFQLQRNAEQLRELNRKNRKSLNSLRTLVENQISLNQILFCQNNFKISERAKVPIDEQMKLQRNFIAKLIVRLEHQQVAQSISIVLRAFRRDGISYYPTRFQRALDFIDYQFTEDEINGLNAKRDNCLFKMYNAPMKSLYSNICHNSLGIEMAVRKRFQTNPYLNKSARQALFTQKDLTKKDEIQQFEICHHCKILYSKKNLVRCQYKSSTHGMPVQSSSSSDPFFILQLIQSQKTQEMKRLGLLRKRNPYFSYSKVKDEFICGRYFCRLCLRQNYESNEIICPFCQGICFCSRCLRNDIIVKLKGIFILLGGDLKEVADESLLERISLCSQPFLNERKMKKQKSVKRLIGYRNKLQECNNLCELVQKRERKKLQVLQLQTELLLLQCKQQSPLTEESILKASLGTKTMKRKLVKQ